MTVCGLTVCGLTVCGLPISGLLHDDDGLCLRLNAAEAAPAEDVEKDSEDEADVPFAALQEHQPLWRRKGVGGGAVRASHGFVGGEGDGSEVDNMNNDDDNDNDSDGVGNVFDQVAGCAALSLSTA